MINKEIIKERLMGPDCTIIIEELLKGYENKDNINILDLGCGKALTSVYLSDKFENAKIFAADLWVDATENYQFLKEYNYDDKIIPVNCDANNMPFAEKYFDIIVSIDAYHYFGLDENIFKEKIKPYLKDNGLIFFAVPGFKIDCNKVPKELEHHMQEEDIKYFKSFSWWENNLNKFLKEIEVKEMECFNKAWENWLSCDNPYAVEDIELLKADSGKYLNLISIKGKI